MFARHSRDEAGTSKHGEVKDGARRRRSLLATAAGLGALAVSVMAYVAPAAEAAAPSSQSSADPASYVYVPLSQPARICDTRPTSQSTISDACTGHTLSAGGSIVVDMPSAVVPTTAAAAVLSVAVTNTAGQGFITVYPTGQTLPTVSSLDYTRGQTISNTVTVALGKDSSGNLAVTVFNGPPTGTGGNADVVVDLEGYFIPPITSGAAGQYTPLSPSRIADTRCGRTPNGAGSSCGTEAIPSANSSLNFIAAGKSINVQVAGLGGVPAASEVTGVVLNVTATNTFGSGYISVYPTGASNPATASTPFSNQQYSFDNTLSTKVVVALGTGGDVSIYNGPATGFHNVDVVVDVDGYFTSPSGPAGAQFVPMSPVRVLDTRVTNSPVAPGGTAEVGIAGANGVPAGSAGAVLNVTDIPTKGNYLTVFPDDEGVPTASDVNYVTSDAYNVLPNAAYTKLGADGGIKIFNGPPDTANNAAAAHVVADLFGYFAAPTTSVQVSVAANQSSVLANGTDISTVTVTVTKNGAPLGSDPVLVAVSGPPGCGTITSSDPSPTNSSGMATFTYTAGNAAGNCTITAIEATAGAQGSTVITQNALNKVSAAFGPNPIPANGMATSTLAITVTNPSGTGVPNDSLKIGLTSSVSGSCGSLSSTSPSTNASGTASVTYTASSTPGFCTATVTEGQTGASGSATVVQTSTSPPTNSPFKVTVLAAPPSLPADGKSTSTITVTVVDNTNSPVTNDPVIIILTPSVPGACGSVSPAAGTTNPSGQVTATYTASTTAGTCTVSAIEAEDAQSGSASITQGGLPIAVTANPSTLPADGKSTSTITVTVGGAGATGDPITLTATPTATDGACGTLAPTNGKTSSGTFSTTYTASSSPGFCVITATEADTDQSANTDITQTPPSASGLTITANPTTVPADGKSTSAITVTVTTSNGTPVAGDTVSFAEAGNPNGVCSSSNLSNISGTPAGTTNSSGQVTATYTASTTGGTCTITATESQAGPSGSVTITQSTANTITLSATPSSVPAGGSTTSTITAHVTSVQGSPVQGDTVTLVAAAFPSGACGSFSPSSGTTNSSGNFTATYTPSATVGFCFVGATESQFGQKATTAIDQTLNPPPSPPYTVTVTPSPASLPADGKSTSTVTVSVMNGSTPIGADPVAITVSGSGCGMLNLGTGTTNASGAVTFTYTASATAGATCTLTAVEADSGSQGAATITQTQPPNTITVTASPNPVVLNGTSTITATVKDFTGAPVAGETVNFSVPSNGCLLGLLSTCSLSPATATTNSAGQATTQLGGLGALGSATVDATDVGPSPGGKVPPQPSNPSASVTVTVVLNL